MSNINNNSLYILIVILAISSDLISINMIKKVQANKKLKTTVTPTGPYDENYLISDFKINSTFLFLSIMFLIEFSYKNKMAKFLNLKLGKFSDSLSFYFILFILILPLLISFNLSTTQSVEFKDNLKKTVKSFHYINLIIKIAIIYLFFKSNDNFHKLNV